MNTGHNYISLAFGRVEIGRELQSRIFLRAFFTETWVKSKKNYFRSIVGMNNWKADFSGRQDSKKGHGNMEWGRQERVLWTHDFWTPT